MGEEKTKTFWERYGELKNKRIGSMTNDEINEYLAMKETIDITRDALERVFENIKKSISEAINKLGNK